jgi:pyruvate kinase
MSPPRPDFRKRQTKIVATLGPATDGPGVIAQLAQSGADVFRLNLSHGSLAEHAARIDRIRAEAPAAAILADLQGPKIRLGIFENGSAELQTGDEFTIATEEVSGNAARASTTYRDFARDVKPGNRVLLADGAVELRVESTDGVSARCRVISGGRVGDRKGINLPGAEISAPSLTEKDRKDLAFALDRGADLIALSFVRRAADLHALREAVAGASRQPLLVAKIEKAEGWRNLEGILEAADGVMVARGDLGVEMPVDEIPFIQKSIIRRARRRGRFVITATQMLESMINSPAATRAEVSDVANAIFDGTDAVMLSAETSVGKYPAAAVRTMASIACAADSHREFGSWEDLHGEPGASDPAIVASAVYEAALSTHVRAIAVFTITGSSARLISRLRPPDPVYAFTPSTDTARALAISYGIEPVIAPDLRSADEIFAYVNRAVKERGWAAPGEAIAIVAGVPVGVPGTTNLLKLHRVS